MGGTITAIQAEIFTNHVLMDPPGLGCGESHPFPLAGIIDLVATATNVSGIHPYVDDRILYPLG